MDSQTIDGACKRLQQVQNSGGALLILTGAGMSVASGVPVFRNSDGSMSPEFLQFLQGYNQARRQHNLSEVDDWFDFSVPEMFRTETEIEAWQYWRWRILRARVSPADDYALLNQLSNYFGSRVFVVTSNCDGLHVRAGTPPHQMQEIHGSLGTLQCSRPCHDTLYPVDEAFIYNLSNPENPHWVPRCPKCQKHCLRPNVMIFGDDALVYDGLQQQQKRYREFCNIYKNNFVALEVGAGTVVPSIRYEAERRGKHGMGLIRINPSSEECEDCDVDSAKYFPLVARSKEALEALCKGLRLGE
jgi:NAD-dependent SIR2 family protein deacetylase